jgi:hypothetical protein
MFKVLGSCTICARQGKPIEIPMRAKSFHGRERNEKHTVYHVDYLQKHAAGEHHLDLTTASTWNSMHIDLATSMDVNHLTNHVRTSQRKRMKHNISTGKESTFPLVSVPLCEGIALRSGLKETCESISLRSSKRTQMVGNIIHTPTKST